MSEKKKYTINTDKVVDAIKRQDKDPSYNQSDLAKERGKSVQTITNWKSKEKVADVVTDIMEMSKRSGLEVSEFVEEVSDGL